MRNYRELDVWRRSHKLVLAIYPPTRDSPTDERFGLTSQLRRSASSIPANIAEGSGRGSDADFARFLEISHGSASETEYHLLLAHDPNYLPTEIHASLADEISQIKRMLGAFIRKLRSNPGEADS